MSLLLIIRTKQTYIPFGYEDDLELVKKDGYKQAVNELAERLKLVADFGHFPTLPNIADTLLYHLGNFQAEIRSLKSYQEVLKGDLWKFQNTSHDESWVENLKRENSRLGTENKEFKAALEKQRSDREYEKTRLEHRVKELEVERDRLYALMDWAGKNKS